MNNHDVSRRWFTETDVKHFKSGALRTTTNIIRSMLNRKKRMLSQVCVKVFFHRYRKAKMQILCRCFSRILQIDSESLTLKMDFFEVALQNVFLKISKKLPI